MTTSSPEMLSRAEYDVQIQEMTKAFHRHCEREIRYNDPLGKLPIARIGRKELQELGIPELGIYNLNMVEAESLKDVAEEVKSGKYKSDVASCFYGKFTDAFWVHALIVFGTRVVCVTFDDNWEIPDSNPDMIYKLIQVHFPQDTEFYYCWWLFEGITSYYKGKLDYICKSKELLLERAKRELGEEGVEWIDQLKKLLCELAKEDVEFARRINLNEHGKRKKISKKFSNQANKKILKMDIEELEDLFKSTMDVPYEIIFKQFKPENEEKIERILLEYRTEIQAKRLGPKLLPGLLDVYYRVKAQEHLDELNMMDINKRESKKTARSKVSEV